MSAATGTWCVRYSLPEHAIESVVPRGPHHGYVRALVTVSGDPIGYVEFPLPEAVLTPALLDVHVEYSLGAELAAAVARNEQPLPDPTPLASVIVCTRDRPDEIAKCLGRLVVLDHPNFEVVVVDNAPTDDRTRTVVDKVAAEHTFVRYVREPKPGLSHARNAGLAAMHGEIAVYTDDDVEVDRNWLREVSIAFAVDERIGCVTGMVCTADIPTPPERYFDRRARNWSTRVEPATHSLHDHDLGPLFPYTPGQFGTGANFSFRRQVLQEMGGFDTNLGAGTPTRGGEDLDAFVRVLLLGYAISYTPRAIVWHHHRATERQLRAQMFAWGVGLGAFVVAHLVRRETRGTVLRRLGAGVAQLVRMSRTVRADTAPAGHGGAEVALPRGLLLRELTGMLVSPWYYLSARSRTRRLG